MEGRTEKTYICERRGGREIANDSEMRGMHQKSGHPEGMSMRRNLHQEEEQEERMRCERGAKEGI